jgi:hypothetical protein
VGDTREGDPVDGFTPLTVIPEFSLWLQPTELGRQQYLGSGGQDSSK